MKKTKPDYFNLLNEELPKFKEWWIQVNQLDSNLSYESAWQGWTAKTLNALVGNKRN